MKVRIEDGEAPATERDVAKFEKKNKLRLPAAYRGFLLRQNGGAPRPDRIAVPGWSGGFTGLNVFFALNAEEGDDLQENLDDYEDRIPEGFLPIADDPGGNLFLLALDGEHEGRIFLWDHEDELDDDGESKQDMSNMYEVATSIDDLLENKLLPDE